jgi:endonuclease YncB( thermonuclease family)
VNLALLVDTSDSMASGRLDAVKKTLVAARSLLRDTDTITLITFGTEATIVSETDTVVVVREGQQEPVRLRIEGMDAPETCQPGGGESRDALIRLALRKPVQVMDRGQDSYGRQIGRLSVEGVDLGAEMVRSGMAWAYSFRTGKGPYAGLQRQAEKQKKGIFATQEAAMSPALFRKFHGNCHGN